MWTNKIKGIPKYILKKIENNGSGMYNKLELDYYRKHKKVPKHPIPSREEKELDKMPIESAFTLGRGTQRLGHAMKKREGLAQRKFKLIQQIEEIENK